MRVMVGVIILYDHVHPVGAFAKTSKIDVSIVIQITCFITQFLRLTLLETRSCQIITMTVRASHVFILNVFRVGTSQKFSKIFQGFV